MKDDFSDAMEGGARTSPSTAGPSHATAGLTRGLATFALDDHLFPSLARSRAVDAITDCVGCMIAGSREALAGPLLKSLASVESSHEQFPALMLGTARYASPADAALYNGAIAHALDYDDTNHPAYAHPSAVLVPTLLALASRVGASGDKLIDAYLIGFEVFGKLGRAMNTQHYKRGWHATSTFGTLAAVLAAGRLLGLSHQQMAMAIGIAASSASGLRANFGSMTKPLHAGYAARNGVLAAMLAQEGFDASDTALEHRYGYLSVFNDGIGFDPAPLRSLGEPLEILTEHGLALKPYPSCGATHPGIEAALKLHGAIGGAPIARVRMGVSEMAFSPLIHVMPHTPLEGKFSLHYCVAAALVFGEVNLRSFTDEKINDPRITELIPRISMELDPRLRDDTEFATEATVETTGGDRHVCHIPLALGKPARWFSAKQLRAKFDDCTNMMPPPRRDALYGHLRDLDNAGSLDDLMHALVP